MDQAPVARLIDAARQMQQARNAANQAAKDTAAKIVAEQQQREH